MVELCEGCAEYRRQVALQHSALRGQLRVLVAGWRQQAHQGYFVRVGGYTVAADEVEDALTVDARWRLRIDPVTRAHGGDDHVHKSP